MDALKRKVIVESQLVRTVKHYRLGHKFEAVGQKTDAKTTLNSSTPNSLWRRAKAQNDTLETLYGSCESGGQFSLSTQWYNQIICYTPPPTQQHSLFRIYPLFIQ